MRAIEPNLHHHGSKAVANPLTTIILFPLVALPAGIGIVTIHDNGLAFTWLMVFVLGCYALKYAIVRHFRRFGRAIGDGFADIHDDCVDAGKGVSGAGRRDIPFAEQGGTLKG